VRTALASVLITSVLVACAADPEGPSRGTYTISFPSTQAAVATDDVIVLVFDGPPAGTRDTYCQALLQGRKRKDPQQPLTQTAPVALCDLLSGRHEIEAPYGEKAIMVIGRRGAVDFLGGCALQTFGDGDAPADVDLALVDVGMPVPETDCTSVSGACQARCTRR